MILRNTPHYYIVFALIIVSMYSTNVIAQGDGSHAGKTQVTSTVRKVRLGGYGCLLGGFVGTFIFPGVGTLAGCALIGGGAVVVDHVEGSCESDKAGLINDNLTAHYVI